MSDLLIGDVVDERYRLTSVLGEGNYGTVFEAEHLKLGRRVALKLLHRCDRAHLERFRREAEAISKISHENVVALHDYGEISDGRPYIVLDLLEGQNLRSYLDATKRLSPAETAHVAIGVLRGLEAAHAIGIVHRDLKPSNIILGPAGASSTSVKVVDFGLAKPIDTEDKSLTQTGDTIGTPQYMSPEQCCGQPLDGRSDIYALGCIMYELVSGTPFIAEESMFQCMARHVAGKEVEFERDVKVPHELEEVIRRALRREADDRYQSADTMLQALTSMRLDRRTLFRRPRKRAVKLAYFGAAAFAALFVVGIGSMFATGNWRPAAPVQMTDHFKWKSAHFGAAAFTAPDVKVEYQTNPGEIVQHYPLDSYGTNYIDVKQYPESTFEQELSKQDARHSKYPHFQAVHLSEKRQLGKEGKLEGVESVFFYHEKPRMEERHVLLKLNGAPYKFKMHATPPSEAMNKMFEKMLESIRS